MLERAKSNTVVTSEWDNQLQVLSIKVLGAGQVVFNPNRASQQCRDHAEIHGWTQRLSNATAIAKRDGISATAQQKYEAVVRLRDHYETGTEEWDLTARARGPQTDQWVLRAIAALKGIDYAGALQMALDKANERKVSVVDVVNGWATVKAVGDKVAELRFAASGFTDEQVQENEKELGI